MPTFLRIMEILSCSMAGILPYLLLLIYPHRNHLRRKSFLAGALTIAMTLALLRYDLASALGTAPVMLSGRLLMSAALLIFAVAVIQAPIGKVLLSSCSVINLYILIGAAADWFAPAYTLRHFLITTLLQLLLLIPYAVNLVKRLGPTLCGSDAPVWKRLWIAPAGGTAVALLLLLIGATPAVLAIVMVIAIIAAAAVSAVMLHKTKTEMITLILRREKPAKKAAPAAPAVQPVDPVQTHYTHLLMRLAEAEHNNQALLLQVMSMEDDLAQENYDQVLSRLNFLRKQLSATCTPTGNSRIDPVVTYFTRQAMLSGIKIVCSVELPELSAVSDEEMTVLISCLMDNALRTCREQTIGTRRIAAATNISADVLQIGVKNTQSDAMDSQSEELNICRMIAARHGGKVEITDHEGVSQVVVTLNI